MNNIITYKGFIVFDPKDKTNKHEEQSSWKKIAMVMMPGEICEYYNWFIKTRYGFELNKPLRGAHISFINDSYRDIKIGCGISKDEEVDSIWDELKKKWDGKEVEITLDLDVRSNEQHWWLNIPNEYRTQLHDIRKEVGLGRPYYGLHMSIGHANERNKEQAEYIRTLCIKYGKEYL